MTSFCVLKNLQKSRLIFLQRNKGFFVWTFGTSNLPSSCHEVKIGIQNQMSKKIRTALVTPPDVDWSLEMGAVGAAVAGDGVCSEVGALSRPQPPPPPLALGAAVEAGALGGGVLESVAEREQVWPLSPVAFGKRIGG